MQRRAGGEAGERVRSAGPWTNRVRARPPVHGNLAYGVTDAELGQLFSQHGAVQSAQVIMDRDTGRSKGFGFVEMPSDQEAIAALNGKQLEGRTRTASGARP